MPPFNRLGLRSALKRISAFSGQLNPALGQSLGKPHVLDETGGDGERESKRETESQITEWETRYTEVMMKPRPTLWRVREGNRGAFQNSQPEIPVTVLTPASIAFSLWLAWSGIRQGRFPAFLMRFQRPDAGGRESWQVRVTWGGVEWRGSRVIYRSDWQPPNAIHPSPVLLELKWERERRTLKVLFIDSIKPTGLGYLCTKQRLESSSWPPPNINNSTSWTPQQSEMVLEVKFPFIFCIDWGYMLP